MTLFVYIQIIKLGGLCAYTNKVNIYICIKGDIIDLISDKSMDEYTLEELIDWYKFNFNVEDDI